MTDHWFNSWEEASKKLWEQICTKNPPMQEDREAFELLAATYIYDLNAVKEFGKNHIHEPIAPLRLVPSERYKFREFFDRAQHPYYFSRPLTVKGKGEYFGSMHMASASFRIATAPCLTVKLAYGVEELKELMKIPTVDWGTLGGVRSNSTS